MLAAVSGRNVPDRASDQYIERAFDEFATSFDAKLAHLAYRAPAIIGALLADAGLERARTLDILDAGCGTGLCAEYVAPYARRLTGVDLSGGMLTQAAEKRVYDELIQSELTAYMRGQPDAFDVIVCADTLVYFGALDGAAEAAALALRPAGHFLFTVETWLDPDPAATFRIAPHGRYN